MAAWLLQANPKKWDVHGFAKQDAVTPNGRSSGTCPSQQRATLSRCGFQVPMEAWSGSVMSRALCATVWAPRRRVVDRNWRRRVLAGPLTRCRVARAPDPYR